MTRRELHHWHPRLSARQLRRRPVAVRLHGTDIVLFRYQLGTDRRAGCPLPAWPHETEPGLCS
jgi:hypothetical protein